jgi:hypothetical protein
MGAATGETRYFTITNTSKGSMTIESVASNYPQYFQAALVNSTNSPLSGAQVVAAGATIKIAVTFKPGSSSSGASTGDKNVTISINQSLPASVSFTFLVKGTVK